MSAPPKRSKKLSPRAAIALSNTSTSSSTSAASSARLRQGLHQHGPPRARTHGLLYDALIVLGKNAPPLIRRSPQHATMIRMLKRVQPDLCIATHFLPAESSRGSSPKRIARSQRHRRHRLRRPRMWLAHRNRYYVAIPEAAEYLAASASLAKLFALLEFPSTHSCNSRGKTPRENT